MSHDIETNANCGYGSSDETASLLVASTSNTPAPVIFAPGERLSSVSRSLDGSGGPSSSSSSKIPATTINGPKTSASLVSAASKNNSQASSASLSSCGGGLGVVSVVSGPPVLGGAIAVTLTNPYSGGTKPILIRQDRTSTYLTTSPQLSQNMGTSEESNGVLDDDDLNRIRSVPDIELQCRMDTPIISVSRSGGSSQTMIQLPPPPNSSLANSQRCRACRSCERRASTTPVPSLQMTRSVSRESVRSITAHGYLSPESHSGGAKTQLVVVTAANGSGTPQNQTHLAAIPPVFITTSPTGSRMIRQSSQPETNAPCCGGHTCSHPHTASLRQLREAQSEGISNIVADSLRINGAMRPFKQVSGGGNEKDFGF